MSSSKDGSLRVWDLTAQRCCQTVTGFKGEVWSLDVNPEQTRVVAGEWTGVGVVGGLERGRIWEVGRGTTVSVCSSYLAAWESTSPWYPGQTEQNAANVVITSC